MKKRTFFVILIIFLGALLFSSCDISEIYVYGDIYYCGDDDFWDDDSWEPVSGVNIYYNDKKLATSQEDGSFEFYYDVSDDATNILDFITVDGPYEINEMRGSETQNRQFELTIKLIRSLGSDTDDKELEILSEDDINEHSRQFSGYVLNTDYERVQTELFFGQDFEYTVATDEEGNFSFYYTEKNGFEPRRIIDFLQPDIDIYDYRIIDKQLEHHEIICNLVIQDKDSSFDMNELVADVYFRCSFDQSGVVLPAGYPSQQKDIDDQIYSIEGVSTMSGVELYDGEKLIAISDEYGFDLAFLKKNTELKFVKEGFSFKIRYGQSPTIPLENDSYFFTGEENVLLEFRGHTEDMEILLKT